MINIKKFWENWKENDVLPLLLKCDNKSKIINNNNNSYKKQKI